MLLYFQLDDNRSPSESALIKWLQDHMPSDGKRIKALRETRRCFARLASSGTNFFFLLFNNYKILLSGRYTVCPLYRVT